jgi:hypothetical protein
MANKPEVTPKADKKPKVVLPVAPRGELPAAPAGTEWDTTEIAGYEFAILVAADLNGIKALVKGNEAVAARIFNRALRIDAAQKLDGRARLDAAKEADAKRKVAAEVQAELLAFDVSTVKARAARKPTEVKLADQKVYTAAEVQAALAAAGIKMVTA